VRVFRQKFTLEDAIGSHACSLQANMRVTNGIPLGSSLLLPVHTAICVQTLKALRARGVPTHVHEYPEDNHSLDGVECAADVFVNMVRWFAKYGAAP
jgi:hypothetical protein